MRVDDLYGADARWRSASRSGWASRYRVRDWMEINHNLFSALKLEKTVYFIVLLLIVLVAAFNIVATLIMVVMEKRKDIAILKSMGATRARHRPHLHLQGDDHRRRRHADRQRRRLSQLLGRCERYQFIELAEGRLLRQHLAGADVSRVLRGGDVRASLLICLLATVYPARQAARLAPVDVIRYE